MEGKKKVLNGGDKKDLTEKHRRGKGRDRDRGNWGKTGLDFHIPPLGKIFILSKTVSPKR